MRNRCVMLIKQFFLSQYDNRNLRSLALVVRVGDTFEIWHRSQNLSLDL